jgi:serine protease Do
MKAFLERLRTRRLASAFVMLAVLSAAIVAGSFVANGVHGQQAEEDSSASATPLKVIESPIAPNAFVRIARLAGPAVVNINTEILPKQTGNQYRHGSSGDAVPFMQNPGGNGDSGDQQPGQGDHGLQDFFNRFFGGQIPFPDQGDNGGVQESLGSGFIVDPKGYIITNYHVINGADKIYVKLSTDPDTTDPGRAARVIGFDKDTDLAVIKIETSKPLPTIQLGNSDDVQVGDWVEAIGSPFALAQTVTAGIISAKNRTIEPGAQGQFQHFLQTDAAINPGNSGGPLLDMNGNVIGVNTAIYTQSGDYQGIGFALPSNLVVSVYNALISPSHKVTRGSIGIQFREGLSKYVNQVYNFKYGVLVQAVQPGGPADKAGIKPGDVINSVNGHTVKNGDDLVNAIAALRPGATATLGYLRNGQESQTTVTIEDRDKVFAQLNNPQPPVTPPSTSGAGPGETKLGLVVGEESQAIAAKIHTPGVVIKYVRPGSFADLQGLEPGLVITHLNRQPTPNRDAFNAIAGKLKTGDAVVFEVMDPDHPENGINYVGGALQ